jgi:hypothetical protein
MLALFLVTLPLVNPWVRGDGVGYYAYARALLIQHDLRFEKDWLASNTTFRMGRVDEQNQIRPSQYTPSGHLDNHFSIGPAILWSPFLIAAHLAVLASDALGAHIPADGFSWPYTIPMAIATALYGFLGLLFSHRLARQYYDERWAFLATLGIWFGSSLPVYMYFNPSWSHAQSVFAVALFLWYWNRTLGHRSYVQWVWLGLASGLMLDVYFPNFVLLLLPLAESVAGYWRAARGADPAAPPAWRLLSANLLYALVVVIAFSPTFLTRKIVFGSALNFGAYSRVPWNWASPNLLAVLFSSDHGLLSWTPIVLFAVLGLLLFYRRDRAVARYLLLGCLAFYYLIASYPFWDGLSSYGNRFFLSLAPIFLLGLTASVDAFAEFWARTRTAMTSASGAIGLFILWNLAFIFQWGTHMIPVRGPISWRQMAHQQVVEVPAKLTQNLHAYLVRRRDMMKHIEQEDVNQLEGQKAKQSKP